MALDKKVIASRIFSRQRKLIFLVSSCGKISSKLPKSTLQSERVTSPRTYFMVEISKSHL